VSDVHVVDSIIREARCDLNILLLHVKDEREEALNVGWRNIVSV
jgi:hypothetical protein